MMLIIVIAFSCVIGIGLFFLLQTGTTIAWQNRRTLQQLQAYYLAQSALQHTSLTIKLLPLDVFRALKKQASDDILRTVNSETCPPTQIHPSDSADTVQSYDLFFENPPDEEAPYSGEYKLEEIALEATHLGMTGAQDGYRIKVNGRVFPYFGKKTNAVNEGIEEDLIVSRFTGGIGGE
jgi:hypothetical protein